MYLKFDLNLKRSQRNRESRLPLLCSSAKSGKPGKLFVGLELEAGLLVRIYDARNVGQQAAGVAAVETEAHVLLAILEEAGLLEAAVFMEIGGSPGTVVEERVVEVAAGKCQVVGRVVGESGVGEVAVLEVSASDDADSAQVCAGQVAVVEVGVCRILAGGLDVGQDFFDVEILERDDVVNVSRHQSRAFRVVRDLLGGLSKKDPVARSYPTARSLICQWCDDLSQLALRVLPVHEIPEGGDVVGAGVAVVDVVGVFPDVEGEKRFFVDD